MIIEKASDIRSEPMFLQLKDYIKTPEFYIKIEGLNVAGSIKLKTAKSLIDGLERDKIITPGENRIIESSSGSLGAALALICKEKGYPFTCVTDVNISASNEKLISVYGGDIVKITEKDDVGGYLKNRIHYIKEHIKQNPQCIWTNQYANQDNIKVHYQETAHEIFQEFSKIDYLVIGAGTTGTLMGCIQYFNKYSPNTRIVTVDALGSVTFSNHPMTRHIPGLGTSLKPEIADRTLIKDLMYINEVETIEKCNFLLEKYSFLAGGSTGTVLSAVAKLNSRFKSNDVVVAISPDLGNKYLDTVYNKEWVNQYILKQ